MFKFKKKKGLKELFSMMKEPNYESIVYRGIVVAGEVSEWKICLLIRGGFLKKRKNKTVFDPFKKTFYKKLFLFALGCISMN